MTSQSPTDRRQALTLATLHERLERSLIDVDARQRAREEATARRDEAADLLIELGTRGYMERTYSAPPAGLSRVPAARQPSRFPSPTARS